jgi:pimeloyl-CoA dehydrogenase small subunit
MDFDLTEEQSSIQDGVRRLLADRYDFAARARILAQPYGWSRELWSQFADMGLLGLPFASEYGGSGASPIETMLVMEAFGRHLVVEPYLSTVLLGGAFLSRAGTPRQRRTWLPEIAGGNCLFAYGHTESQARYELADVTTAARRDGDSWIIDGHKRVVIHGDTADQLIVSARVNGKQRDRDGLALFLVDARTPGLSRRGYLTQDHLRAADLQLRAVRLGADCLLGEAGTALPVIEAVTDTAIAALCAEAVGAMGQAHELTVEYLKSRKQFGVTIGSFQALQHRSVDMLVAVEQSRSMMLFATMMCEAADPLERAGAISAAKAQIGRSSRFIGDQAMQLHGGIGVTEECSVGHYHRRLTMIEILFGDSAHHLKKLADAGGLIATDEPA